MYNISRNNLLITRNIQYKETAWHGMLLITSYNCPILSVQLWRQHDSNMLNDFLWKCEDASFTTQNKVNKGEISKVF